MGTLNNAVNTANQNEVEIRRGQSKNMFKPYAKNSNTLIRDVLPTFSFHNEKRM